MISYSNQKIHEKELPKFIRGICWFCKNPCNDYGYTHEACIIDYFIKPKQRLIKA